MTLSMLNERGHIPRPLLPPFRGQIRNPKMKSPVMLRNLILTSWLSSNGTEATTKVFFIRWDPTIAVWAVTVYYGRVQKKNYSFMALDSSQFSVIFSTKYCMINFFALKIPPKGVVAGSPRKPVAPFLIFIETEMYQYQNQQYLCHKQKPWWNFWLLEARWSEQLPMLMELDPHWSKS